MGCHRRGIRAGPPDASQSRPVPAAGALPSRGPRPCRRAVLAGAGPLPARCPGGGPGPASGTLTPRVPSGWAIVSRAMPIYEYRCSEGHTFEVMQRITEDPVSSCEVCGSPVARVLYPVAVHFKGSGFYNTDYGTRKRAREMKDGKVEGASTDGAPSKDSGGASGSGGASDSSSAKSSSAPAKASAA